ncbi:MAG TPA: HD domain-containing phosphohydrolase [Solirubrobacteraceae bacterium]|nr:HD domain-containing phosphohydrolase [Solirubrobacteraceae bacterium]
MSALDGRGMRLAELVAVLSLGTDLGLGQPMEHVLRQCLIALRLADRLELDEDERAVLYYTALLAYVGCHVDAHEQAKWLGDDLVVKADARRTDLDGGRREVAFLIGHLGAGRPPLERLRLGLAYLSGDGRRALDAMFENHWIATEGLTRALGLGQPVVDSLGQTFERWDGKGLWKTRGDACPLTARVTILVDVVEVFHRVGGVDAAVAAARERSGTQFDPDLVALFADEAPALLDGLDAGGTWDAVIDAEPSLHRRLADPHLERALEAIADFTDLKSPFHLGHSRRVGDLAAAAAERSGRPADDVRLARRAGLVHDLGRLGVPNTIWDKPAALAPTEWERVRLHPYLSERMLSASPALAPLAAVAGRHHERLDGSGYPRGLHGDALTATERVLAVADAYTAMTEPRAHRAARAAAEAVAAVRDEVRSGRLDARAADAVLGAAGHSAPRRRPGPAGLTAREIEVLRLVARGLSSKQIAQQLVISRKTARNHVQNIYVKAGVSNRAQASVFAVRHGLLSDAEPPRALASSR